MRPILIENPADPHLLRPDHWGTRYRLQAHSFHVDFEVSPQNKRISILTYDFITERGADALHRLLERAALANGLTKIWVKADADDGAIFSRLGYRPEATIPDYFAPGKPAAIFAKFFGDRRFSRTPTGNQQIRLPAEQTGCSEARPLQPHYQFKFASDTDLPQLASLYKQVFSTYPNPIHDAAYLQSTVADVWYGIIYRDGETTPVAAASADINRRWNNAEMTDFATLPTERGKGLASYLLHRLEKELAARHIWTWYTILRSTSPGMNLVFAKAGYHYTGTLINNCHISGDLEDMNVFCKTGNRGK